jgi:hypothetical protein
VQNAGKKNRRSFQNSYWFNVLWELDERGPGRVPGWHRPENQQTRAFHLASRPACGGLAIVHLIPIPVRTFHKLPPVVRESYLATLVTWPSISHSNLYTEVGGTSSAGLCGLCYKFSDWPGRSCGPVALSLSRTTSGNLWNVRMGTRCT